MFAFYDINKDDLIEFFEFLHGLAYRKKQDKRKKIFEDYNINNNEYIDRRDFLRMFRSYYFLFRQMHRDVLESMNEQQMSSTNAHKLVSNRQPLFSAFENERYSLSPISNTSTGKTLRPNGELEIYNGKEVIIKSSDDTRNREDIFLVPARSL